MIKKFKKFILYNTKNALSSQTRQSLEQQQQKKKSNTASQSLVSSPVAVLGKLEKSEKALLVKTRRVLRRLSNKHIGIGVSNSTSSSDSASVPKQEEGRGAPSGPLRKGESRGFNSQ